jgi:hypothetical protein
MEKMPSDTSMSSAKSYSQTKGLEELVHLVNNAKNIVLLSLRFVSQAFPNSIEQHQELMGMISNIIIEVFAMESCLVRTQKLNDKFGEEKGAIPIAISQVYILDAFMRAERWAKLIFAAIAEGDVLQAQLTI